MLTFVRLIVLLGLLFLGYVFVREFFRKKKQAHLEEDLVSAEQELKNLKIKEEIAQRKAEAKAREDALAQNSNATVEKTDDNS